MDGTYNVCFVHELGFWYKIWYFNASFKLDDVVCCWNGALLHLKFYSKLKLDKIVCLRNSPTPTDIPLLQELNFGTEN